MPAREFGRQFQCWQGNGRKACKKDPQFREMEADMHSMVPVVEKLVVRLGARRSFVHYVINRPYDLKVHIEPGPIQCAVRIIGRYVILRSHR